VVGVFGIGVFAFLGDALVVAVVFAVDIAVGLEMVLAVVGLPELVAAAGLVVPFACPFEDPLAAFFCSTFESIFAGFGVSLF
jgi:hypothetical protein